MVSTGDELLHVTNFIDLVVKKVSFYLSFIQILLIGFYLNTQPSGILFRLKPREKQEETKACQTSRFV